MSETIDKNWLSTSEAARYTGLSKSFFYHNYERIPHVRLEGNGEKNRGIVRYERSTLDEWMRRHTVKAAV